MRARFCWFYCSLVCALLLDHTALAAPPRVDVPSEVEQARVERMERASVLPYLQSSKWLAQKDFAQQQENELLAHLKTKTDDVSVVIPRVKQGHVMDSYKERHNAAYKSRITEQGIVLEPVTAAWGVVYEDIMLVRALLKSNNEVDKRAAMLIAINDAALISGTLSDQHGARLIYESFVLPNLVLAHPEIGPQLSQPSLLLESVNVLIRDGERAKAVDLLRATARFGDEIFDRRSSYALGDRARYALGFLLREDGDVQGAMSVLKRINHASLQPGANQLILSLEAKQQANK